MKKTITLILILVLSLTNFVHAQESCSTAGQLMELPIENFKKLCDGVLKQDPACKKIKPEKRMTCSSKEENEILSSSDLGAKAFGCIKGFVWDSMVELGKFIIELIEGLVGLQVKSMVGMYKFMTDSDYREQLIANSKTNTTKAGKLGAAFLKSSGQYFAREFPKNAQKHPLNPMLALGETLLKPISELFAKAAESIIAEYVPQYECMNGPAKLHTLCKVAGEIIMPPAFVLGFMKYGIKGLKTLAKTQAAKISKLKSEFSSINEISDVKKAPSLIVSGPDYTKASPAQAEKSARAEKRAKKPQPEVVTGADYTTKLGAGVFDQAGGAAAKTANPEKYLDDVQKAYNENLVKRFPDLDYVLKDPDAFMKTMDERFAAQKKLTPDNPHLFDYSEVGMPMLKFMEKSLIEKIDELTEVKRLIESGEATAKMKKTYPLDELNTNLNFLQDLMKETGERLKEGKINYKDTVELSSWFSQAVGNFDTRQLPIYQRKLLDIDRAIEAHIEHPIADEYAKYKKREFRLFEQDKVSVSSGYEKAGPGYEAAVLDKEKLGVLLIPSHVEIDCDVLMRLGSRERLSIVGVTKNPILADGFNRPAYDFWLHDVRHETVKFMRKNGYMEKHNIPADKMDAVNKRMDAWSIELQNEVAKIPNPDMKRAAELIVFNFHHDRGYPISPSQYVKNREGKYIEYLLQTILTVSGQGSQVKNPLNIRKASAWLEEYWKKKMPEEEAFLKSLK